MSINVTERAILLIAVLAVAPVWAASGSNAGRFVHVAKDGTVALRTSEGLLLVPLHLAKAPDDCKATVTSSGDALARKVFRKDAAGQWSAEGQGLRTHVLRAGLAVPQDGSDGWAHVNEALATRTGYWHCSSPIALFEGPAASTRTHPAILMSVAQTESRRGQAMPYWPWTLNVGGRGYYFDSREDAYSAIQWLLRNGYRNFDIGLAQTNWRWHGHRYASPWDALQPHTNLEVAGAILREHYDRTGSWETAVRHYHNKNPDKNAPYLRRFLKHLEGAQRIWFERKEGAS